MLIFEGPLLRGLDPRVLTSRDLNDLPKDYWEFGLLARKLIELPALRRNAREALHKLARHMPAPGRLLDFGCGWGFFLDVARELGWQPSGIEPLPGHSLYARSKLGLEVITDTLRAGQFPADHFDAITAFQVFEHLPDPQETLRCLTSLLKPGGVILIEVPNIDTWGVRLLGKRHRHYNPDHINFFSAKTLGFFLERNHYQVLEVYHPSRYMTYHYLVNFWLRRLLPAPLTEFILRHGRADFWGRILPINLGDILGLVARKLS